MNGRQYNDYDTLKRGQQYVVSIWDKVKDLEDMADESQALATSIAAVEEAAGIQDTQFGATATEKKAMRHQMADTMVIYTDRAKPKAIKAGNKDLYSAIDNPHSYYLRGEGAEGVKRATLVLNILEKNDTIFTNIKAADIKIMKDIIDGFSKANQEPTITTTIQKTQGTDKLDELLNTAELHLNLVGGIIHSHLPNSDYDTTFQNLIVKGSANARHNIVLLEPQDATTGQPIEHATAFTNDKAHKAETENDEKHVIEFPSVRVGKHLFTVQHPDYNDENVTVQVKRGTTTVVVVKMTKK